MKQTEKKLNLFSEFFCNGKWLCWSQNEKEILYDSDIYAYFNDEIESEVIPIANPLHLPHDVSAYVLAEYAAQDQSGIKIISPSYWDVQKIAIAKKWLDNWKDGIIMRHLKEQHSLKDNRGFLEYYLSCFYGHTWDELESAIIKDSDIDDVRIVYWISEA